MRTRIGSVTVVAMVALALILVVFGSAVRGPWVVTPGSVLNPSGVVAPSAPAAAPPTQSARPDDQVAAQWDASWLPMALTILSAIAGLVLLFLLGRLLARAIGRGRLPLPDAQPVRAGDLLPTVSLPRVEALRQGVQSAQQTLEQDREPADAVVAAWIELEASAERSGVPRHRSQTPTEFTLSVLSRTSADATSVLELRDLYLVARFSNHPVTATDVETAGRCLAAIAVSLTAETVAS